MPPWIRRRRARCRYRHFQDDVAQEIEAHRAMTQSALERSGAATESARAQAARTLGNATLMREDARAVWIAPWLESLWQDVRYAARSARRRPGFSAAVILILALGSGLVATVFSLAYGAFLRPWPIPDPNSVVVLHSRPATANGDFPAISIAEFMYLDGRARSFQQMAFVDRGTQTPTMYHGAEVGQLRPLHVSRGYLDLIRSRFVAGRGFTADEHDYVQPKAVAVLGRNAWRRIFGADPSVVGETIQLGKQTFTIVGVASTASFVDVFSYDFDVAIPLAAQALGGTADERSRFTDPKQRRPTTTIAGRLASGVTVAQALAELTTLSGQFRDAPQLPPIHVRHVTTRRVSLPSGRAEWPATKVAFLGLLLMHLLACANAGNLLLARGMTRQRELAIRQALGAGRRRIVRQLLVETVAFCVVAGVLTLVIVWLVPPLIAHPLPIFDAGEYTVGPPVLAFCLALTVLTALATGLAPAIRSTGAWFGIGSSTTQGPPPRALKLRRALLAAQVAFATALLVGAGLLGRAVEHASATDPGFPIHEIAVIELKPPRVSGKLLRPFRRDLERALAAPGLPPIGFITEAPLSARIGTVVGPVRLMDEPSGKARILRRMDVSENYFEAMGIRLVAGRGPSASEEAVVSVGAARQLWPGGENPLGQQLRHGWMGNEFEILTVVGVAPDVATISTVDREASLYKAADGWGLNLLVRDLTPAAVERVRAAATALLPGTTVTSHPLSDHIRESLAASITSSRVAWGISALGLLLATIGAFGVFAYAVEERKREIGIRMALGARRADVIGTVWTMAQRALLIGLALGLAMAVGAAQLLRRFLFGLSPFDPMAYLQIAVVLTIAAVLATWIPARRAARVDPAVTLRTD